jgi:hypothetical protein
MDPTDPESGSAKKCFIFISVLFETTGTISSFSVHEQADILCMVGSLDGRSVVYGSKDGKVIRYNSSYFSINNKWAQSVN